MRFILFAVCAILSVPSIAAAGEWKVTAKAIVIDGDTLNVGGVTVNLSGIDAPELRQNCTNGKGAEWSCGASSQRYLASLVYEKTVTCTGEGPDQKKHYQAVCHVKAVNLNAEMVRAGWAFDYPHVSRGKYASEEDAARKDKKGIWTSSYFMKPWDWRNTSPRDRTPR